MPGATTVAELGRSRELTEIKLAQQPIRLPVVAATAGHSDVVRCVRASTSEWDDVIQVDLSVCQPCASTEVACPTVTSNDRGPTNRLGLGADEPGAANALMQVTSLSIALVVRLPLSGRQPPPLLAALFTEALRVFGVRLCTEGAKLREHRLSILGAIATMSLSLLVGIRCSIPGVARRATGPAFPLALRELLQRLRLLAGPTETDTAGRVRAYARLEGYAGIGRLPEPLGALVRSVAGPAASAASSAFAPGLRKIVEREYAPAGFARLHRRNDNRYVCRRTMIRVGI